MKILVAYATRHGATQGIAERIAQTLEADGLDVTLGRWPASHSLTNSDEFAVPDATAWMLRRLGVPSA